MIGQTDLVGSFTLSGTSLGVKRMGYGAMQLAGPHVFGPPRDTGEAIAVLREAVESGVNHIDTSDYYGPHVTNQIIRQALHPYPKGLVIVTKLGARRGADASWIPALSRQELIDGTHDNLKNLGLDALDVVNLRVGARRGVDGAEALRLEQAIPERPTRATNLNIACYRGKLSPNMGSLLLDSSLVASGWITSQCSSNTPSLIRIMSTTTMAEPSGLE